MTVAEVFELRRQGRYEEAYEAIRPMYAAHKGPHTSLCMFWCARDILKVRVEQGRISEARLIFLAMHHLLPKLDDANGSAHAATISSAIRLARLSPPAIDLFDFVQKYASHDLCPHDLSPHITDDGTIYEAPAKRLLNCCVELFREAPDADHMICLMPLLQSVVAALPGDIECKETFDAIKKSLVI